MNSGFLKLIKEADNSELALKLLDGSSYDQLIEADLNFSYVSEIFHIAKKYSFPPADCSYDSYLLRLNEMTVHPEDRDRFNRLTCADNILSSFSPKNSDGLLFGEFRFKLFSGGWLWVSVLILSGAKFGFGNAKFRIYVFDIQSRKIRELSLDNEYISGSGASKATSGLLDKDSFIAALSERIKSTEDEWCIASIDIENFKLFNEWYGHDRGDALMAEISSMLIERAEKSNGIAGYFGQDDFCIFMPYSPHTADELYGELYAEVNNADFAPGFLPAIGICMVDKSSAVLDMLDRAFLATRFAKENYHQRIRLFTKEMYAQTDEEYHIISDFMRALKQGELVFYLQPQCRASTGRIVGAEALARWIKPDGTVVPPNMFIPILEKHGLISDLDKYIWEEVCKWQRSWIDRGNTPLPVSVNVSPLDVVDTNLADFISKLTEKYRIPRNLLKIEITESAYIINGVSVIDTVKNLRETGFTVLMDDFGSGYSSLNMLRSLNIDAIKLDAQFLRMNKLNEIKGIHIIESIINMTKILGIPVIVEGVETCEQARFLEDLGCRYIQGYYFFRPMSLDNYEKLISVCDNIDISGIKFKANEQFRLREILDNNIYSDTMLNNILGPSAFYELNGKKVDIVRFNEQFYKAVNVNDFTARQKGIQNYIPKSERKHFFELLKNAENDRLNGSSGVIHFYRPDGDLECFLIRFYFLREKDGIKNYFGAVQNITRLTRLETQISMLMKYSSFSMVSLTVSKGKPVFSVLFHGLEEEIGLTAEQIEEKMNGHSFLESVGMVDSETKGRKIRDSINNRDSFLARIMLNREGQETIELSVSGNSVLGDKEIVYILTFRTLAPNVKFIME